MRAGAYTIHQSLTAEAAAVLKLALGLARRRGHAQVTPLHVAFTLLSSACSSPLVAFSSSSSSPCCSPAQVQAGAAYGLLRRACLRSHPAASPAAHPLQCRALELCFNVALNRLPTCSPHSPPASSGASPSSTPFSSSLIQPNPTLSNALVAALKRAQANQRRGCVELQQQQPPPPPSTAQQQGAQQQQPLLAIKVELDQLIISILDDPSVSRVMREAGFSSATVKSNLEEESALMLSSSSSSPPPSAIPPHFFLDPSIAAGGGGGGGSSSFGLWPAQFLSSPGISVPSCKEDVKAVLEVMVRKQGRRTNPVIVGDTVSMAEAVTGELLRRLERGDVPEELAGAHLLKLQLSYVHVRLMSRADVDAKSAELRRNVDAVQRGGLVVYVGDLRWALDEEPAVAGDQTASSYSPVDHMVTELGRLLGDLRASTPPRGRVWLVATASYHTYMRCQHRRRRSSLEAAWALQAVVVPTGSGTGLALNNLHSSSPPSAAPVVQQAMVTKQPVQGPFTLAESMAFAARDEQEDKLVLCTECSKNYEREASVVKAEAEGPCASLPGWLMPDKPPSDHQAAHKDKYSIELKRKWSRLCQKLHMCGSHADPCSAPCFGAGLTASSGSWWSATCLMPSKPTMAGFLNLEGLIEHGGCKSQWSPPAAASAVLPRRSMFSLRDAECQDVRTTLALGSLPLSDSATSDGRALGSNGPAPELMTGLERRLRKEILWQPGAVTVIVEAVAGCRSYGKKCIWMYMKGSDHAAKRRAALVIAETHCGSADKIICADPKKFGCAEELCSDVVSRASKIGSKKFVLVVDDIEHAPPGVVDCLVAASKNGSFKDQLAQELDLSDSIVILTTSTFANGGSNVIRLRLWPEEPSSGDLKRKTNMEPPLRECKRPRHGAVHGLDLNICAHVDNGVEEDEAVPSDITHEGDTGEHGRPHSLESIATRVVTLDKSPDGDHRAVASICTRLVGAVDREVCVNEEAAEALATASGHFLDEVFGRWVAEVFEPAVATVKNGGKVVLGVWPGGGVEESGFMGSVLPSRVHVD